MRPIEYIGPAPQKKKRKPVIGGWVILLMTGLFVSYFAWPTFADYVKTQQVDASVDEANRIASELRASEQLGDRIAAAALEHSLQQHIYDSGYYQIDFPAGDIPQEREGEADLLVRSFRSVGVDLQERVHQDMDNAFRSYPQLWGMRKPDSNIDHRRIPNLQRYFERIEVQMSVERDAVLYENGDVVIWRKPDGSLISGIVVPGPGARSAEKWVVSNRGFGSQWIDSLLDYDVVGHYKYQ
ncbi:DUF1287 domain-containing protein [Rubritalea marina]|uniref:DUF1287 domain-containing protein n=1 Tax=Rubritalea marina TaxID=361055 RepID=UPI0003656312|nr:DUF1287 domain-containing protein [Rubritalea marina]